MRSAASSFEYNLGGHVLSQSGTVKKLTELAGVGVVAPPFGGVEQIVQIRPTGYDPDIARAF